jgi:prepilin signal peptidase PulO-like enzyme (type II secretory pathway)
MLLLRPSWDMTVILEILGAFALFYLIRLFTRNQLGTGDVKYSAMIAAFIGFPVWFAAILFSSIAGLLVGFFLILTKKINTETKLPFAPFLAFGAVMAFFIRDHVMKVFSGLIV